MLELLWYFKSVCVLHTVDFNNYWGSCKCWWCSPETHRDPLWSLNTVNTASELNTHFPALLLAHRPKTFNWLCVYGWVALLTDLSVRTFLFQIFLLKLCPANVMKALDCWQPVHYKVNKPEIFLIGHKKDVLPEKDTQSEKRNEQPPSNQITVALL